MLSLLLFSGNVTISRGWAQVKNNVTSIKCICGEREAIFSNECQLSRKSKRGIGPECISNPVSYCIDCSNLLYYGLVYTYCFKNSYWIRLSSTTSWSLVFEYIARIDLRYKNTVAPVL